MVTTTTVYSFQKPAVAGDEDAWGGYLNNNIDKYESILTGNTTITNVVITTADINGGTLDNVVIGGSTAAAITGTTITGTSLVGLLSTAAQTNITSLGTLTTLTVDNINVNGNIISSTDTNGHVVITPNGTGNLNVNTDVVAITATEDESAALVLSADEADDNADTWRIASNTGNTLSIENQISGSSVNHVTLTPNATVANSTAAFAGNITVANTIGVGNTVLTGASLTESGDFAIDVGGEISLDADGGVIRFKDGGSDIGLFSIGGTDFTIRSLVSDRDIIFKGNDGGSTVTALTLNMSEAGAATFNSGITVGGDIDMGANQIVFNNNSQAIQIKDAAGTASYVLYQDNADTLVIGNGTNVEKIRLDTSGNENALVVDTSGDVTVGNNLYIPNGYFFVGTTDTQPSSNNDASGITLRSDGKVAASRSNGISGDFNTGADGEVVWFRKAGTETGKIAISGNDFQIFGSVSNVAGINFANSKILPMKSGSLANDAVDLGSGSYMYKDAYINRDIFVGSEILHIGDNDTKIGFDTNQIDIYAGGTQKVRFNTSDFISYSALKEDYDALSGTTPTIDVDAGGGFSLTMSGNTTFTFSSCTSGVITGFVLQLTGNGSTVTYPNTVRLAGGTAPDAPGNGETDILVFFTRDGGSNWYGILSSDAAS